MDSIGDLFPLAIFIVFVVVGLARKIAEQKRVAERQKEGRGFTVEELPEKTRRAIFGPEPARPAPRRGPFVFEEDEEEDAETRQPPAPPRREVRPAVAQPRAGHPAPPPLAPARPPARPRQAPAQRARPAVEQQAFRPVQESHRQAPPPQQRRDQPERHRPPVEAKRPVPPIVPKGAPHRGVSSRVPVAQPVEVREGPAPERRPVKPSARRAPAVRRPERALFADLDEVRRGVILSEVLGPPKALR